MHRLLSPKNLSISLTLALAPIGIGAGLPGTGSLEGTPAPSVISNGAPSSLSSSAVLSPGAPARGANLVQGGEVTTMDPSLEWRNLAGETRKMSLTKAPGESLDGLFGSWMRPIGFSPLGPLEFEDRAELSLSAGDRLQAQVLGGDAMNLEVLCPGKTGLSIPIDSIRSLVFPQRNLSIGVLKPAEQGDRLYRLVGKAVDRVDGVLGGFSAQGVLLETSLGERVYPWGEVVALFIEDFGEVAPEQAEGPTALVDLTCGSRLRGQLKSISANEIRVEHGGLTWSLPHSWVREMTLLDGRFRFLSWLDPVDSGPARSPFDPPGSEPLGMVWPHRVDRSVGGQLLHAGGRVWTHGLGVHAPSQLQWELDGSDCWLRLSAGLDASAVGQVQSGSVVFQVLVDGKEAWNSGLRRGGEPVTSPDPIALKGAKKLELIVSDGGDGPVLDRAAWLAPILVRCE